MILVDSLQGKKTYIGLVIILLSFLLGKYGIVITGEDQAMLMTVLSGLGEGIGLLIAAYGRWRAANPIKTIKADDLDKMKKALVLLLKDYNIRNKKV